MLILAFILATIALAIQGVFHPALPFLAYAPLITLSILRSSFKKALWVSAFCGLLLDLLSDDPMGIHALGYTLTTGLIYRYRRHFSFDSPLHLSLFSSFTSLFLSSSHLFLLFLFDRRVPFDGKWAMADLASLPAIDALYAFVWIAAPLALYEKARRMWSIFWLKRNSKLSPTSH